MNTVMRNENMKFKKKNRKQLCKRHFQHRSKSITFILYFGCWNTLIFMHNDDDFVNVCCLFFILYNVMKKWFFLILWIFFFFSFLVDLLVYILPLWQFCNAEIKRRKKLHTANVKISIHGFITFSNVTFHFLFHTIIFIISFTSHRFDKELNLMLFFALFIHAIKNIVFLFISCEIVQSISVMITIIIISMTHSTYLISIMFYAIVYLLHNHVCIQL